jgi:hypothetical protein
MVNKNLISQALQVFNRTTSPNLLAELSEETLHIQEISEEVMSQVWGGAVPPDPYVVVRPAVPPDPYVVFRPAVPPDPYVVFRPAVPPDPYFGPSKLHNPPAY